MRYGVSLMIGICLAAAFCLAQEVIDMTPYNPKEKPGLHSNTRDVVCLNGVWGFMPIYDKEHMLLDEFPDPSTPPEGGEWTDFLVPGIFRQGRYNSDSRMPDGKPRPGKWNKANRGWYKKEIDIPAEWEGKSVCLEFKGVAFYAKVFVNDKPVGEHKGPVTPFSIEIGDSLDYGGKNTIWVYVVDQQRLQYCPKDVRGYKAFGQAVWHILPEVWEYRARVAGIWKDVFIVAKSKFHVEDIFAMPSFRNMEITGRVWVNNPTDEPISKLLVLDVLDTEGNEVLEIGRKDVAVLRHSTEMMELTAPWKNPKLWDIDEPNLYYMRARLLDYTNDQNVSDEMLVRFGFRETWVEKDQLYLNGRIIHLFGDWVTDNGIGMAQECHRPEYFRAKYKSLREDLGFVSPRQIGHGYEAAYDVADEMGFPVTPTGYAGDNVGTESFDDCAAEWAEYIRSLRNHPSILIYSIQNESLVHIKTRDFFILQRKLDQLVEELDGTRPYYHDGHVARKYEDPGDHYRNGDMSGNAPLAGGHYTIRTSPMSRWMHEFDLWRREKPFIYGEAGTFSPRDIKRYATMFYGEDYNKKSPAERAELGGKVVKMVVGSWRSYAVPGLMIHSTYQNSSYNPVSRFKSPVLKWNDLNTPGAKPFGILGSRCRFNPYQPDNQPWKPNAHAAWMKKTFAPLLVTLYRDLRHNFLSGEKVSKTVYLVNDTKKDLAVNLDLTLKDPEDGKTIAHCSEKVNVTQGRPVKVEKEFTMPTVSDPKILVLRAEAKSEDGTLSSEDDQEISVYPEVSAPRVTRQVFLHDTTGKAGEFLKSLGIKTQPMDDSTFKGDAAKKMLLIAPYSFSKELAEKFGAKIDRFIQDGGVVVALNQSTDAWETTAVTRGRFGTSNIWITDKNFGHPIFKGLASQRVYFWAGRGNLVADSICLVPDKGSYELLASKYLFEMKKGKGALIGCNMLLPEKYKVEPEAALLTRNLLEYVDSYKPGDLDSGTEQPGPDVYLSAFYVPKEALDVSQVTDEQKEKFHFVNLKHHANGVFGGKKYDAAFNNVMFKKIPLGDWNFAGVPFHVVDSDNEDYLGGDPGAANSCIILRGKRQPKYPVKAEGIIVDQKARRIHFLHTSAWALTIKETTSDPDYDTVTYRLVYEDGTTADLVAKNNVHIRDWWFKEMRAFTGKLKESPAGWVERNIVTGCYGVLWVQSCDNPHPEKVIKQIDIISAEKAVPLVFAITLEE